MLSFFRHFRTYFNQLSNNRRQLSSFTSIFSIQSNVNHSETRKLSTSKSLSIDHCSVQSKETFLNASNHRHLTSQIHSHQNFSSRFNDSRQSERDSRTVFVTGLSKDTTEDSLRHKFSKYWVVTNCTIIRDKTTGASRKFGFVELATVEEAHLASKEPLFIDCKEVSVIMSGNREWLEKYRIFVGGLLKETSRETLFNHFSQFGDVFSCNIMYNEDNLSQGFGFVTYKSQDSLDRAVDDQPHVVDDVKVEINYQTNELDLVVDCLPQNMSKESLEKSLLDLFSGYGRVRDCRFIKNSAGNTTAFVAMSSKDETSRALADRPHYINGKLVSTHLKGEDFTILLYDLPSNTTDDALCQMFSKVAKPIHWNVFRNRKLNANFPTINGYVSFSSPEEVDRVMERSDQYSINGKLLTIQRKVWMGRNKQ
ncbi:RNA recognition motif domain-containing protein [Ditylenchus destructor]|nr:RNA recognition motif domain-containing protein [Ditylenchus destructor]